MFDLLVSSSVVVDDVGGAVDRVTRSLGVPAPKASWYAEAPGLQAVFCRVHPSMAVSPTRFELIAPAPVTEGLIRFYVPETVAMQGARPIKTHATAIATSDQPAVIERLQRLGVPHRVDEPPADSGVWPLVWVGSTPDDPASYDASVDAGLIIEVVATESLHLRPETFADDANVPSDLAPGAMVRVAAKGVLVNDLDAALRALDRSLGWEPVGPVTTVTEQGYRYATLGFALATSAVVELIQPVGDGPAASFMTRHGPGPYHTRITVTDLGAKADDLRSRGTPFDDVDDARRFPSGTLRVFDPTIIGAVIEFVAHGDAPVNENNRER